MAFNNIIGNDKNKSLLCNAIENNNILHSYMFYGVEGIGKLLFAKEFSKMIFCEQEHDKPCNKCVKCIQFDSSNNPDFQIIKPDGKVIKIDQIRNMQEKVQEKPMGAQKKVFIIQDAEKMTKEAQNCLLKTLEEPPSYIVIILVVSNESSILNTVKSRCMKIKFENLKNQEIEQYFQKNNIDMDKNLIELCDGSIEKAIMLNDNRELYIRIINIIKNLPNKDFLNILEIAEPIYKEKENILEILDYFNIILYNMYTQNNDIRYLNGINDVEETKKRFIANSNFDMTLDNLFIKLIDKF